MCLSGGAKFILDTEMKLLATKGKPNPAALGEVRRVLDLGQTEDARVELPRRLLRGPWHCQLDVVQSED